MAHADLTQADHDLLVRIAREHALKVVAAAEQAVADYAQFVDEPTHERVLDAHGLLGAARRKLGEVAG